MLVPPANLVARAKATIKECSVTEVSDCFRTETLVIDIREADEFARGHIPGAVHVPRGLLEFEVHGVAERYCNEHDSAPEVHPIILYCGTGGRSALAAETMALLGYQNVRSMAGGIVAWAAARLPLDLPE